MLPVKRKRTPNFSEDEKMRFVRLLQEHGDAILTKVTCHDLVSNREKDVAWTFITEKLNAVGNIIRTEDTLKKLWQKLKSDAKTFKSRVHNQTKGTGGGPSIKLDDPVLELVANITGRGTSGIEDVEDCDSIVIAYVPKANSDEDSEDVPGEIICNKIIDTDNTENVQESSQTNWTKRRQPVITEINERTPAIKARSRLCNSFAAERLRAEKEKTELIQMQKKHMLELHELDMENKKLKRKVLETLINHLTDGKHVTEAMKAVYNYE